MARAVGALTELPMRGRLLERWSLGAADLRIPCRAFALAIILTSVPIASCDVFHLANGGTVEGELLAQDDRHYKIRTVVGTITLPVEVVKQVETCPSPWEEYEQRRAKTAETAAAHVKLAEWCDQRGLAAERRKHLNHALELDPNNEPARQALGFVRVGQVWVEGKTLVHQPQNGERKGNNDAEPPDRSDEKVVRAIQGSWTRRIRAIRSTHLYSRSRDKQQAGRDQILAIKDPLAILPLMRELGSGRELCREILVEALRQFKDDEATLNLAVLALIEQSDDIRDRVLVELVRRQDPRVTAQFRKALRADAEVVVRRAATGLARLEYSEAVGDLIEVLTVQRRKMVEVPVRDYFHQMPLTFTSPTQAFVSDTTMFRRRPQIGYVEGYGLFPVYSALRLADVTVFRTEVLEALRQLTGRDFGFEVSNWKRWYQEQKS